MYIETTYLFDLILSLSFDLTLNPFLNHTTRGGGFPEILHFSLNFECTSTIVSFRFRMDGALARKEMDICEKNIYNNRETN